MGSGGGVRGGGGGGGGRGTDETKLCLALHCLSDKEFCTKTAATRAVSILTQFIN